MDPWTSQNRSGLQLLTSAAILVAGGFLALSFRGFGSLSSNAGAGFLLGMLLLVVGVLGALWSGKQTVTVDPKTRSISVEDSYLVGAKKRSIPFSEVERLGVGYLGRRSSGVTMYYLALTLNGGETYPLFAAGRFYEGASDREVLDGWRRRLEEYLHG